MGCNRLIRVSTNRIMLSIFIDQIWLAGSNSPALLSVGSGQIFMDILPVGVFGKRGKFLKQFIEKKDFYLLLIRAT